jgi:hypothetical protein
VHSSQLEHGLHISRQCFSRLCEAHSDHQHHVFEDDPAKLEDFIDAVSGYMRLYALLFAVS